MHTMFSSKTRMFMLCSSEASPLYLLPPERLSEKEKLVEYPSTSVKISLCNPMKIKEKMFDCPFIPILHFSTLICTLNQLGGFAC